MSHPTTTDPPVILHPPTSSAPQGSPSSRISRTRSHKLKKTGTKRGHTRQQSSSRASINSTTSSLDGAKHVLSSWLGNIRAGVTGAWTKARGDYETYVASQEGEARMREKRNDVLNETGELAPPVAEERGVVGGSDRASSSTSFKRPASSDGNNPASKKRSLNAKKLKKQKSLGKLPFRKSSVSRAPPTTSAPVSPKRATATPVYRASIVTIPSPQTMDFSAFEEGDDGLRTKVLSLENEVNSLRAKLRWFEQSYGEIPADTLADITTSPRKRKSAFKEEWGSLKTRGEESQILPDDIRELKGTAIDPILEESSPQGGADPESTIKLIPASPSAKSVPASSPRRSPTKMTSVFSPGQDEITVLETLSPIHPNIMRPRVGFAEIGVEQENLGNKY